MSNQDIKQYMRKIYGIDVSPDMATRIIDKILPIAKERQSRWFEPMDLIIYLDGLENLKLLWIIVEKI